jgi:hypothetical protein
MQKLDPLPIGKKINLIVVSDHAMMAISNDKKVAILDHLKLEWYGYAVVINPIMSIKAKAGHKEVIADTLKKGLISNGILLIKYLNDCSLGLIQEL